MRDDFSLDISGRRRIQPTPLGAAPGLLDPVGWRRYGADENRHTHDDDSRLAAPVDNEALIISGGKIHDLAKLGAGFSDCGFLVNNRFYVFLGDGKLAILYSALWRSD